MINMSSTEESLEPATVTLIAYRGIGLQPPKGKKKAESKKAKWKVLFCHGQEKKMSTAEIVSQEGNPVWDTTATIAVGNSYEPLVLLLHYRDTPIGQVIIPWTRVPDKSTAIGQSEILGELEAVRKSPEPTGAIYYSCWIESYRPHQSQQQKKPPGLLKRLSLSRSKLSASSVSIAEDQQQQQQAGSSSRKATVPTVKKLKRRLFNRGGKSTTKDGAGVDCVDGPNGVSKAVSMGNLSSSTTMQMSALSASGTTPGAYSVTPSPSASPASLQRHPMARPHSLHNLALDQPADMPTTAERQKQQQQLRPLKQQTQQLSPTTQLGRSRSAACLFAGPTYPSVDTDRPLPEIQQMEPSRMPALGGQRVTIRGVALALSASDLIGASLAGVPCRAVSFISPEQILLTAGTAPNSGATGPAELVTVTAGCVRSEASFTYVSANAALSPPASGSGIARSPSLNQLPFGGSTASGVQSSSTVSSEIHHARSSSLEATAAAAGAPKSSSTMLSTPPPALAAPSKSPAVNMKKSRSVWDMRLGRRGSDASNDCPTGQQQQQQPISSVIGAVGIGGVKLRKRDSGKGTLSKKQLLQETELLRAHLEAAHNEQMRLTEALMDAERLALEAEQRAMEAEARARLEAEAHEDKLLELTNFIDSMQARIIESGHVELLEKSPPRPPRC